MPARPVLAPFLLLAFSAACGGSDETEGAFRVAGAASLSGVLGEALEAFGEGRGSFASSGVLARQIQEGAPYDLFVSADVEWIDRVTRDEETNGTSVELAASRLVIATAARTRPLDWRSEGRWTTGDPAHVPLGRTAKRALSAEWPGLVERLVPVEDARAALRLVRRGEVDWGVLYAHDARTPSVTVIEELGEARAIYVAVLLTPENAAARVFFDWLMGKEGRALFARHGFDTIP